jgi:hypothetical protein
VPISSSSLLTEFSHPPTFGEVYIYAQIIGYSEGKLTLKVVFEGVRKVEYFSSNERVSFQSRLSPSYIHFVSIGNSLRVKARLPQEEKLIKQKHDALPILPVAELKKEPIERKVKEQAPSPAKPSGIPLLKSSMLRLPLKEKKPLPLITRSFDVRIENLNFSNGWIKFSAYLSEIGFFVSINIKNEHSIKELNYLKGMVVDQIGSSMVQIEVSKGAVKEYKGYYSLYGRSSDLLKIDRVLLKKVAFRCALDAYKSLNLSAYKASDLAMTAGELLSRMPGGERLEFSQEEQAGFIESLYRKDLHEKHLRYLSSMHLGSLMVVRLMQNEKKENSLLYLLKGAKGYFFAWETANTANATYLWMVEGTAGMEAKEAKLLIKIRYIDVENALNFMRNENREVYLKRAPKNFFRVLHSEYELDGGFEDWKQKLESLIN